MAPVPDNVEPVAMPAAPAPGRRRRWFVLAGAVLVLLAAGWIGGWQAWGWHHWRLAQQAMQRLDFSNALEHYECCVRVWSGSVPVRLESARAARRCMNVESTKPGRPEYLFGRFDEHLSVCEKKGMTEHTALERVLLRAQEGDMPRDVEESLLGRLLADHAEAVSIDEAMAVGYIVSFRHVAADKVLADLLRREPEHKWAYTWRANIREENDRLPDAVRDLQRAVEIDPKSTEFRLRLALALVHDRRAAEAWPHIEELLQQTPSDAQVLLAAAQCQRDLRNRPRAMELLERLLEEHADHAEAWALRGRIAGEQGDAPEAIRCLRQAFELEPRDYQTGHALYNELTAQGKDAEARLVFQKSERAKQQALRFKEIWGLLGKDGGNVALRHELGTMFLKNGNEASALRWFDTVLKIDPDYRPTHRALAEYYEQAGNAEATERHRERAGTGR
jgi:tetratricopeptide (TPR) repeat protein